MINEQKISVIVHTIAGVAAGIISYAMKNNYLALLAAFLILIFTFFGLEKVLKKDSKWLMSNGLVMYITFWLVTWIMIFNYNIPL
jgi:hypothetical protein